MRSEQPRVGTRKLHKRIKPTLNQEGIRYGRDKLFELLRERRQLVKPKRRYRQTTHSRHGYAVAPNLFKSTEVTKPNQVYVSDITYVSVRGGFAYLFLVTDAYSRRIMGYHLSRDLSHHSALLALAMAARRANVQGVIHHSDRGCQYCCHEYIKQLNRLQMHSSMTDENHCYQNAIAERLNGILKDEFDIDQVFPDFDTARLKVAKSILIYNTKRDHWSLELQTPDEVYRRAA